MDVKPRRPLVARRTVMASTLGLTLLLLILPFAGSAQADEFVTLTPEQIEWVDVPSTEGLRVAMLAGNPNAEGLYVMRVRFSAGVFSQPHSHDRDRFVTVIEGTWYAGTQTDFDKARTVALPAGSFMKHPAGGVHYDGAKDEATIVEIRGMGPVVTTYLDD